MNDIRLLQSRIASVNFFKKIIIFFDRMFFNLDHNDMADHKAATVVLCNLSKISLLRIMYRNMYLADYIFIQ